MALCCGTKRRRDSDWPPRASDPRDAELVHQPILERAIEPLTAAARLRRIRRDVLNAQPRQGPADLGQPRLIDGPLGLRRVKRPVRAVGVERHRQALRRKHGRRLVITAQVLSLGKSAAWSTRLVASSDTAISTAAGPARVNHSCTLPSRCSISPKQARGSRRRRCRPRARCFFTKPGRLQRLLQKAVRHRHAMLAPRDLMKVPHIEPVIPLPIEPQEPLDLAAPPRAESTGACSRLSTSPT